MCSVLSCACGDGIQAAMEGERTDHPGEKSHLDPRGSGLLFFMFIRPHPYTCLGNEWLTQGGVVYYFSCL